MDDPPVVPDSADKTWEEVTSVYGIGSPESMEAFRKNRAAIGSGVVPDKPAPLCTCSAIPMRGHLRGCPLSVPDKPALAPTTECRDCGEPKQVGGKCCAYWETGWRPNAPVPAVTDDEAAVEKIEKMVTYAGCVWDDWPAHPRGCQSRSNFIAQRVVADLRSAGFLIVHHTKET